MNAMISETVRGIDKVNRYGWIIKDEPGLLMNLHKDKLQIHPAYQRDMINSKVKEITSNWSWIGAGAIVVGDRGGEFWIIDGQHRVLAAKRRSDITFLPCVVFKTDGIRQEAIAFLDLNTGRKPVTSLAKFKAMIAAGYDDANTVSRVLKDIGVTIKATATNGKEFKGVAWAIKRAGEDSERFYRVMRIAAALSQEIPLHTRVLDALWYIDNNLVGGIEDKRFMSRLHSIGERKLLESANRAAAYFASGGAKVWAQGIVEEVNKGLRVKFELRASE